MRGSSRLCHGDQLLLTPGMILRLVIESFGLFSLIALYDDGAKLWLTSCLHYFAGPGAPEIINVVCNLYPCWEVWDIVQSQNQVSYHFKYWSMRLIVQLHLGHYKYSFICWILWGPQFETLHISVSIYVTNLVVLRLYISKCVSISSVSKIITYALLTIILASCTCGYLWCYLCSSNLLFFYHCWPKKAVHFGVLCLLGTLSYLCISGDWDSKRK